MVATWSSWNLRFCCGARPIRCLGRLLSCVLMFFAGYLTLVGVEFRFAAMTVSVCVSVCVFRVFVCVCYVRVCVYMCLSVCLFGRRSLTRWSARPISWQDILSASTAPSNFDRWLPLPHRSPLLYWTCLEWCFMAIVPLLIMIFVVYITVWLLCGVWSPLTKLNNSIIVVLTFTVAFPLIVVLLLLPLYTFYWLLHQTDSFFILFGLTCNFAEYHREVKGDYAALILFFTVL